MSATRSGLSLVPLIGFAGHVSLAQYALAGIGAVCMAAFGRGGTPMGFVWAIAREVQPRRPKDAGA